MYYLLARNEEINKWLGEHPAILGAIALVLGLALLGFGISALVTGQSRGKYGREMKGSTAYVHGAILAVAGVGCVLFALYQLISALI